MGDDGVPQFDKTTENTITNLNPIKWQYSTLWRADAWEIMPEATPLYEMGPSSYSGSGYTSFHKYYRNGVNMYVSSIRLAKIGDGSAFNQVNLDNLVASIVGNGTTGVKSVSNISINLYPNPTTDYATINTSSFASGLHNVTILTNNEISSAKMSVVK